MPKIDGKSKVLAISNNPVVLKSINAALKNEADFILLDSSVLAEGVERAIAKLQPELVLLDFEDKGTGTYGLVDKIATEFPGVAVVVILSESKVQLSEKVILSGARAFILYPFTQKNLLATARRVVELLTRNFPTLTPKDLSVPIPVKPKNTFTVFSPTGGTGCTTIVTNLAIALFQLLKEPVLLVDGKHLFGHVALMLNLRTGNSITDLITHAGMLDQQLINQVVVDHVSGIKVLPSPIAVTEAQGIRPDDLYKVILGLQATFPITLIDGGNFLQENTVTYMDASDKILLIMNPTLASIRDVRQFIEVCKTLLYPPEKIILVLNNTGHKADIRSEEIEKILGRKITCAIPADDNFVISSVNEGIPVMVKNPHHPISKAIQGLAAVIKNVIAEANASYLLAEKNTNAEVLAKTSRLG